jgi:hypothetical protein
MKQKICAINSLNTYDPNQIATILLNKQNIHFYLKGTTFTMTYTPFKNDNFMLQIFHMKNLIGYIHVSESRIDTAFKNEVTLDGDDTSAIHVKKEYRSFPKAQATYKGIGTALLFTAMSICKIQGEYYFNASAFGQAISYYYNLGFELEYCDDYTAYLEYNLIKPIPKFSLDSLQ